MTSLTSLNEILTKFKEKDHLFDFLRVPVVEESAPTEACFDLLVASLKEEPASTQCVFSCQMGRGRTTLGARFHFCDISLE